MAREDEAKHPIDRHPEDRKSKFVPDGRRDRRIEWPEKRHRSQRRIGEPAHDRVEAQPLKLDGEPAYRITIPPDGKTLRPVECVLAYHGGRLVVVIGGTKEMAGLHEEIEELVATWKMGR